MEVLRKQQSIPSTYITLARYWSYWRTIHTLSTHFPSIWSLRPSRLNCCLCVNVSSILSRDSHRYDLNLRTSWLFLTNIKLNSLTPALSCAVPPLRSSPAADPSHRVNANNITYPFPCCLNGNVSLDLMGWLRKALDEHCMTGIITTYCVHSSSLTLTMPVIICRYTTTSKLGLSTVHYQCLSHTRFSYF